MRRATDDMPSLNRNGRVLDFPAPGKPIQIPAPPCACGIRIAPYRCHFPVRGQFCDAPLCERCAARRPTLGGQIGAVYCPDHEARVTPEGRFKL
jgi:hypothetical protein